MAEERKQIKVRKSTYDRLTDLGRKNETYDEIISRLLESYESEGEGR